MNEVEYSVVVPFYNEEENLKELNQKLVKVLSSLKINSEIVYIDDGSSDRSLEILKNVIKNTALSKIRTKIVSLQRNFGQTAAVSAGIDNASGEYISFLDADLQNDPDDLPKFIQKLNEGYDAVFGWRKDRNDPTARSFLSKLANWIIESVFSYPYHDVGCSARIVRKKFLKNLQLYGELHRIMPVLIYLRGARVTELVVKHHSRKHGKSKYGFNRIVKIVIDIVTVKFLSSYGTRPAYVFGTAGLGSFLLSGLAIVIVLYKKIFEGVFVHREPMFLVAIFLGIVGIQFILMGLMAELQVRTYFESQKKPIYEIKEIKSS